MKLVECIMADTTVCSSDTPTKSTENKASIRKSNKPLMEKRRRARINSCLGQLKSLVLQALKKDTSQFSKLEKADILEMTVKHLKGVQQQQMTVAMATDPNVLTKYRAGFNECAGEVMRYLGSVNGLTEDMRTRVLNHLAMCMQSVNTAASVSLATQAAAANQATLVGHMTSGGHCGIPASFFPAFPPQQFQAAHVAQATPTPVAPSVLPSMTGIAPRISQPPPDAKPATNCPSSLQLIPGTLPSGQLAFFVASPATIQTPIQAIPVYTSPSSGSTSPISSPEISPRASAPPESCSPVTSTSNLGALVEKREQRDSCAESSFSLPIPRMDEHLPMKQDQPPFGAVQKRSLEQVSAASNTQRDVPRIPSPARCDTNMEVPHALLEHNEEDDEDKVWRPW